MSSKIKVPSASVSVHAVIGDTGEDVELSFTDPVITSYVESLPIHIQQVAAGQPQAFVQHLDRYISACSNRKQRFPAQSEYYDSEIANVGSVRLAYISEMGL